jgi:hypothetical protein
MGTVNRSAIIRVVVLLFPLAVIISERGWIRDEAITLWVSFYSFLSELWRF